MTTRKEIGAISKKLVEQSDSETLISMVRECIMPVIFFFVLARDGLVFVDRETNIGDNSVRTLHGRLRRG